MIQVVQPIVYGPMSGDLGDGRNIAWRRERYHKGNYSRKKVGGISASTNHEQHETKIMSFVV